MFNQLLSRLFGQETSAELSYKKLNQQWAEWLLPIDGDKQVGEDLTYQDTFQDIKEELAKFTAINYAMIAQDSEIILKQSSKDIRIATYYALARLHLDGTDGFADGLEIIACLLHDFGEQIYPSRSNIRKNAIEWLASEKFSDKLKQLIPINEECLTRILVALNLIEKTNQQLFLNADSNTAIDVPDLSALVHLLANNIRTIVKSDEKAEEQPITPSSSTALSPLPIQDKKITSQEDLFAMARKMALFLRESPDGYLAAGRLLRVIRWDIIHCLPPADHSGKTRLPAPRNEIKQHIGHLITQQKWSDVIERAEDAFIEKANHFWLDLQRATVLALQKMGEPYQSWAEIYITDLGLMLDRLPGIERLRFDNNMPLADEETLEWISNSVRIHHLNEGDGLVTIEVSGDDDWNEIEYQALDIAKSESLENAFKWLQNLSFIRSPKQHYLLNYCQARIAEQMGNQDVALTLLINLNNKQQTMPIMQWEPELIYDIKRQLLRLLNQKMQHKEGAKLVGPDQIERLKQELMLLNPTRALSVM